MIDNCYPTAPGFKEHGGTSEDADHRAEPRSKYLRTRALSHLRMAGPIGLAADEVAYTLGESILSIRPRISELYRMGLIEKTGERRKNPSGMAAAVWRALV